MKLHEAISQYANEKAPNIAQDYIWKINMENFPLKNYSLEGNNDYQQCKNLRIFIHNHLKSHQDFSDELQIWYVKNWGGVKGNKSETLIEYVNSSSDQLISLGKKGVATWSKMLAVRDPLKYVIYDARVAVSLNSLQRLYKTVNPYLFPQLPSQNKNFVQPTQKKIISSKYFLNSLDTGFYQIYLELLNEVISKCERLSIQDIEMILFSSAKELSEIWSK